MEGLTRKVLVVKAEVPEVFFKVHRQRGCQAIVFREFGVCVWARYFLPRGVHP